MASQSVIMTIPFGQTEDIKIVDFGKNAQVSLWYDYTLAITYFKNNTETAYYMTLAYYDGELIPVADKTMLLKGNDQYSLDRSAGNQNNQQLAISNASLTLVDSKEVVLFDYNNVCIYNNNVSQNTILLSIDTISQETSGEKNKLG